MTPNNILPARFSGHFHNFLPLDFETNKSQFPPPTMSVIRKIYHVTTNLPYPGYIMDSSTAWCLPCRNMENGSFRMIRVDTKLKDDAAVLAANDAAVVKRSHPVTKVFFIPSARSA